MNSETCLWCNKVQARENQRKKNFWWFHHQHHCTLMGSRDSFADKIQIFERKNAQVFYIKSQYNSLNWWVQLRRHSGCNKSENCPFNLGYSVHRCWDVSHSVKYWRSTSLIRNDFYTGLYASANDRLSAFPSVKAGCGIAYDNSTLCYND